ncbi:MAG: hypothetical protein LBD48_10650 [Treponema sp.]|nr:hypothetical protein [Treponema sp.]
MLFKILGYVFGSRKSFYSYSIIAVTAVHILIGNSLFPGLDRTFVYAGYASLTALFTLLDFDKVSRAIVILLVIISLLLLVFRSFGFNL